MTRYARPAILEKARLRGVEVVSLARKHRYDLRLQAHEHGSSVRAGLLKLILGIPLFFAHQHSWPFAGDRRKGDVEAVTAEPALPEGPAPVERKLERLAEDLPLNGSVHFLGLRGDNSTLLNITDVSVIASRRTGSRYEETVAELRTGEA